MVAAGARRFVVVRWLTECDDPKSAAHALRRAIDLAIGDLAIGDAAIGSQSTG
jgi:hypothetical protein